MVKRFVYVAIILLVVFSCRSHRDVLPNIAYRYNSGMFAVHPQFVAFRTTDTTLLLYTRLRVAELIKPSDSIVGKSFMVVFHCSVYDLFTGSVLDTSTYKVLFHIAQGQQFVDSSFIVSFPCVKSLGLQIQCIDRKGEATSKSFILIDALKSSFLMCKPHGDIIFNKTVYFYGYIFIEIYNMSIFFPL